MHFFVKNFALVILTAVLIPVTIWHPYLSWPAIRWDGEGYHLWTYAFLRGDLNFERFWETHAYVAVVPAEPERGWYANKYPPGVALIQFPVMAFLADARSAHPTVSEAENYAALIMAALALLGTAYFALRSARLAGAPEWAAQFSTLAVVFGTGLFHYATFYGSYSHIWSALGISALMFLGLRALMHGEGRLPTFPTAIAIFLLVLVRSTNLLAIGALVVAYLLAARRRGLPRANPLRSSLIIAIAVVASVGILVAISSYPRGRLVFSSYSGEEFLWNRPMAWSVLTAYNQGLLLYAPLVAVVAVAGLIVRATRPATTGYLLLLLATAFLYGYWYMWMLGAGFGHRGFVELMPPAVSLLAVALGRLPRWGRITLIILVNACVLVTLELMIGYWRGTLPWHDPTREAYFDNLFGVYFVR
jgi:hypothetical protein